MSHDSPIPPVSAADRKHEDISVDSRIVFLCGLVLLGLVAMSMLAASGIRHFFSGEASLETATLPTVSRSIAAVPLDPLEKQSRQTYEDDQRLRLTTYAWADRSRGKVRIPIARAMTILVDKQRKGDQ